MSAVLRDPPVRKIESLLARASDRVALMEAKVDEIPLEDAEAVVKAENAVATAKAEKLVLERALQAAQKAAKAEAKAQADREKEARRARLVARAESLQPKLLEVMESLCRLLGENQSVCDALPGPDAMKFWYMGVVEEASRRACKNVKPKTMPTEDQHGRKYVLITNSMVRTLDIGGLTVPLVDVD